MPTLHRDRLPNGRTVIWTGGKELQVAVAEAGGHIAALRAAGIDETVNPYWQPPWPSFEPSAVTEELVKKQYGGPPEGRLLASILGHSLALDLYGAPSKEEEAAGAVTHGRMAVGAWTWQVSGENGIVGKCHDTLGQLQFLRKIKVRGPCAVIEERMQNLCAWDRPLCWQQHVSFGPPFCEDGFWATANCDRGTTHPESFGPGASLLPDTETRWPSAPQRDGRSRDYREPLIGAAQANDFSGYRVRVSDQHGHFITGNRHLKFALFYIWPRNFFPWLGIWDERHARVEKPWCEKVSVRAFEFGASPYPDTRRNLLRRPALFDIPTYLILPANGHLWVRYLLGVFPGIAQPAELDVSATTAMLLGAGGEIGRIELPEACASADREEMKA
jgi:hypothetical protein